MRSDEVARIDKLVARRRKHLPGIKLSRSDIVRGLILAGLELAELRDASPVEDAA